MRQLLLIAIRTACKHDQEKASQDSLIALDTSFAAFFTKFNTDSVFQKAHVEFPLPHTILNNKYDPILKKIPAKDWKFLDLSYNKENANLQTDAYYQEIAIRNDNNIIYVRFLGIENGIHIEFTFKKVNGQ